MAHPTARDAILLPDKRTTFGVVEMTTGCGRRCQFCVPDLNPQIDVPKEQDHGRRPRQRARRQQADLARHRGHVHLGPGAHRHAVLLSRTAKRWWISTPKSSTRRASSSTCSATATIAPAVVDPVLDRAALGGAASTRARFICRSQHPPEKKALVPLDRPRDRLGAHGQADHAEQGRAVSDRRLAERRSSTACAMLNENNWFPVMTLIVGNPGETDDDVRATLDLIYEVERRGLFAFLHPVDLHAAARHAHGAQDRRDRDPPADAAAVAADDEVLEDEPAAGSDQLVGPDGLARGSDWSCGSTGCAN